ncbi:MAG: signal peptidase II [Variovorax sp.]
MALVIVLLDQLSKWFILGAYQYGDQTPITGFFNIVRAHNTGAAFSFLAEHSGWQRWLFTGIGVAASAFIVVMLHRHRGERLFSFAMTLILGGAIGNVIDRVRYGYVVDFLDFYWGAAHFPAFNLADSAITLGAVCLVASELIHPKPTDSSRTG